MHFILIQKFYTNKDHTTDQTVKSKSSPHGSILVLSAATPCGLALTMEAVCSSEMLVSTYNSAQHYSQED
jgi:hypothetical protein